MLKTNPRNLKTARERLKYIREELLKLSRAELFKKHQLSPDTLAAWENGRLELSEKGIERCIKIYNAENLTISKEWLLTGEGLGPNFTFDLNRYLSTLPSHELTEKADDAILLAKEIDFFRSLADNSITELVKDDGMLPVYSPGDHVGGRLCYGEEIVNCVGKNCIINTNDGSTFVRKLTRNIRTNNFNLICLNLEWCENPEPIVFGAEVASAAPIIWHRRPAS